MRPLNSKFYILNSTRGQTMLSLTLLIGGLIILFGTSLAVIVISFLNSTYGFRAANAALALARGGLSDAQLRLERDSTISDAGYCVPAIATPCPSGYALVAITQNSPAAGQVTVTSDATVSNRRRKVQGIFQLATSTGLVVPVSSQTLSL